MSIEAEENNIYQCKQWSELLRACFKPQTNQMRSEL
jgi:hypothetical protein